MTILQQPSSVSGAATDIAALLEGLFKTIENERMSDVPILNRALRVEAIGFREWDGYWLGVLITPWFMNLVLISRTDNTTRWQDQAVGSKHKIAFPAGTAEFILCHEAPLGRYLMSSLFSPVMEFADHDAAHLTAVTVLDKLFDQSPPHDEDQRDKEMAQIWAGKIPVGDVQDAAAESHTPHEAATAPRAETSATARDGSRSKEYSRRDLFRFKAQSDESPVQ